MPEKEPQEFREFPFNFERQVEQGQVPLSQGTATGTPSHIPSASSVTLPPGWYGAAAAAIPQHNRPFLTERSTGKDQAGATFPGPLRSQYPMASLSTDTVMSSLNSSGYPLVTSRTLPPHVVTRQSTMATTPVAGDAMSSQEITMDSIVDIRRRSSRTTSLNKDNKEATDKKILELREYYMREYFRSTDTTMGARMDKCRELIAIDAPINQKYKELDLWSMLQANRVKQKLTFIIQALGILEKYASNLIKPTRTHYWRSVKFTSSLVRTYLNNVKGSRDILKCMGYTQEIENGLSFPEEVMTPDIDKIKEIAADLLLARVEVEDLISNHHPYLYVVPLVTKQQDGSGTQHGSTAWPEVLKSPLQRIHDNQSTLHDKMQQYPALVPNVEPEASPESESDYEDAEDGVPQVLKIPAQSANQGCDNTSTLTDTANVCRICGKIEVKVFCNDCHDTFCMSCDQTFHTHRSRQHHIRKQLEVVTSSAVGQVPQAMAATVASVTTVMTSQRMPQRTVTVPPVASVASDVTAGARVNRPVPLPRSRNIKTSQSRDSAAGAITNTTRLLSQKSEDNISYQSYQPKLQPRPAVSEPSQLPYISQNENLLPSPRSTAIQRVQLPATREAQGRQVLHPPAYNNPSESASRRAGDINDDEHLYESLKWPNDETYQATPQRLDEVKEDEAPPPVPPRPIARQVKVGKLIKEPGTGALSCPSCYCLNAGDAKTCIVCHRPLPKKEGKLPMETTRAQTKSLSHTLTPGKLPQVSTGVQSSSRDMRAVPVLSGVGARQDVIQHSQILPNQNAWTSNIPPVHQLGERPLQGEISGASKSVLEGIRRTQNMSLGVQSNIPVSQFISGQQLFTGNATVPGYQHASVIQGTVPPVSNILRSSTFPGSLINSQTSTSASITQLQVFQDIPTAGSYEVHVPLSKLQLTKQDEKPQWQCEFCTLHNSESIKICEMCHKTRTEQARVLSNDPVSTSPVFQKTSTLHTQHPESSLTDPSPSIIRLQQQEELLHTQLLASSVTDPLTSIIRLQQQEELLYERNRNTGQERQGMPQTLMSGPATLPVFSSGPQGMHYQSDVMSSTLQRNDQIPSPLPGNTTFRPQLPQPLVPLTYPPDAPWHGREEPVINQGRNDVWREVEQMRIDGKEYVDLMKIAETLHFLPEELNIAIDLGYGDPHGPIHWLQTVWYDKIHQVMLDVTEKSKHQDIGNISPEEVRQALIEHTGDVPDASKLCVEDRTKKLKEVMDSGIYVRTDCIKALDSRDGKVEEAIRELEKMTFEPMRQRVLDRCVLADTVIEQQGLPPNRQISAIQEKEIFEAIVSNREVDFERRTRVIFAEYNFLSWGRAETAIKLIDRNFPVEDSIEAANANGDLERSLQYLQRECILCAGNKPENHMVTMLNCQCRFCRDCVATYVKLIIHERNVMQLVCPQCSEPQNLEDDNVATSYFNHLDIMIRPLVDSTTHDLFQQKLRDRTLMKEPNFRWCSHCSSGFINEQPNVIKMACPNCNKFTCFMCKKQWEDQHEGISCEQFTAWKEANDPEAQATGLAVHLKQNGIECPNCKFRYDLAKGGCMHFKCVQCSHEFCSGCYEKFRHGGHCPVLPNCVSRGLHAHHPRDCLFYLRDREPEELQELLRSHNIAYDTEPPRGQIREQGATNAGFDNEAEELQGAAAAPGHCRVSEQIEVESKLEDKECGRPTPAGYAGLCRLHFTEYLVERVNANLVDPVGILSTQDLEIVLKREDKDVPEKGNVESDNDYHDRILQLVNAQLPLPKKPPRKRVLDIEEPQQYAQVHAQPLLIGEEEEGARGIIRQNDDVVENGDLFLDSDIESEEEFPDDEGSGDSLIGDHY